MQNEKTSLKLLETISQQKQSLKTQIITFKTQKHVIESTPLDFCNFQLDKKCTETDCKKHAGWRLIRIAQNDIGVYEACFKYRRLRREEKRIREELRERRRRIDLLLEEL